MIPKDGNVVRNARVRAGIGRDAFAKRLGVSVSTVGDWEQGRNGVSQNKIYGHGVSPISRRTEAIYQRPS